MCGVIQCRKPGAADARRGSRPAAKMKDFILVVLEMIADVRLCAYEALMSCVVYSRVGIDQLTDWMMI